MSPDIPLIDRFDDLAGSFPVVFCDVWGVIHNGARAMPAATQCLKALRRRGHAVILISNSPRPSSAIPQQFAEIGVDAGAYDRIVTSGDATREVIRGRSNGRRLAIHHIGPERDLPIFDGLKADLVAQGHAELVVCTGLIHDEIETPDDYAAEIAAIAASGTDFLCANPDIVVQKGDRLIYCAGALAESLEALGGKVIYPGKPHRPIYELAYREAVDVLGRNPPLSEILAIGDGIRTDLLGAARFGISSLFILDGIHGEALRREGKPDLAAIRAACDKAGVNPLAVMESLRN